MQVQQEPDRVPSRHIVWITVAVLVATTAFVLLAAWVLALTVDDSGSVGRTQLYPAEINDVELTLIERTAAGSDLERTKRQRLASFGWLEQDAGVLHIPIASAMALYLRQQPAVGAAVRPSDPVEVAPRGGADGGAPSSDAGERRPKEGR